ncbi:hypothetical protein HN748_00945 [Candidatus Peregrinibacteria bacterium]|jgi:hypothetical protein|nr:hypothetical protein [Candidatus Peregrinibacteria bacterium]MBT7483504.1 hypothetical protein [Candidatus Peregrinibacteria bacterium]MBT7702778.1 hypothetical protein [Candidatus Peregrinibacteria bacterium]
MKLSKEAIQEFQLIYSNKFGENIEYEEAEEMGTNLIHLFQILMKIDLNLK